MQLKRQSEPSVRITVSIPNDAVNRLRQLAAEGSQALRAIGILGIQLEGDSVISLKLAGQDINVKASEHVAGSPTASRMAKNTGEAIQLDDLSHLLGNSASGNNSTYFQQHLRATGTAGLVNCQQQKQQDILQQQRRNIILGGPSTSSAAQQALLQRQQQAIPAFNAAGAMPSSVFKSPNTICPMEGKVPLPPQTLNSCTGVVPANARDFPFESMRQARVLQGRGHDSNVSITSGPSTLTGVLPMQSLSSALLAQTNSQSQIMNGANVAPPNVALKVVKNPQSGEILTTITGGVPSIDGKTQFLQPPPPPYPGVGASINAVHTHATVVNVSSPHNSSKSAHQTQNFITQNAASTAIQQSNNNIATSSPLLVNLLQSDGNLTTSVGSANNQQLKSISTSQPLIHQSQPQQQQSPLASISPNTHQQHLTNSPMREFMLHQHQTQSQPMVPVSPDNANLGAIVVPSSPTTSSVSVNRNIQHSQSQGPQQIVLSPNNIYSQQRFHQQQVTPQQVAILRHQQMQRQQQMQQQASINTVDAASPQRFIQQQQIVNTALNQMRQIRPAVNLQHQTVQQPTTQFMNSGGISPVAHSPASSHHSSMHSPLAMPTHQQLLSPSTTPGQSPHHHSHISSHPPPAVLPQHQQQIQSPQMLPSPVPSQVPSSANNILPPPPDYNQAAAARWPALNKPMDSATKSSFQEFTRYQMQYNLQQQMNNNNQQQQQILEPQQMQIQQIANSSSTTITQLPNNAATKTPITNPSINNSNNNLSIDETNASGAAGSLPDALMSLSDLDGLTPNDLDALLPSLSCDLDSTLSLEDKNELESLLQDAKDLDLDLIGDELSAVGVDISDAATAANALIDEEVEASSSSSSLPVAMETNSTLNIIQTHNIGKNIQQTMQQSQQQLCLTEQQQLNIQNSTQEHSTISPQQKRFLATSVFTQQQQQHQNSKNSTVSGKIIRSASAASTSSNISVTTTISQKQLIINPLTGELEPMPSDDSETEAEQETQHLIKPPSSTISNASISVVSSANNGSSYIPAASEALPSILFSAEEDSNSCSTAVSKLSEHNGLSIIGSDTERSRDSLVSNKSASRNRKGSNKNNAQVVNSNKHGNNEGSIATSTCIGSPNVNYTQSMAAGGLGGVVNKKAKPNLLREKLQQGVRERKKDNNNGTKIKRERTKGGSKMKAVSTSSVLATHTAGTSSIATVASIAQTSATNEKIKLRLKLEKTEPVSPAYKVDVTFVPSPKLGNQSSVEANLGHSGNLTSSSSSTTSANFSGGASINMCSSNQTQNLLNTQMLASNSNALHQQYSSQQTHLQTLNNLNLPSTISASTTTSTPITSTSSGISASISGSGSDEPRVPPLLLSLRGGKNSIVIKNSRSKDRKKVQTTSAVTSEVNEDSKIKPLKRSLSLSSGTQHIVDNNSATDVESGVSEVKQVKLLPQLTLNVSTTQYNGSLDSGFVGSSISTTNPSVSKTTAMLANKNGLIISSLSSLQTVDSDIKNANITTTSVAATTACSNIVATNSVITTTQIGTLPQLLKQQQLSKASPTNLPSSITLSTVNCSSSSSGTVSTASHRVIANLQIKNAIKSSAATITPIVTGGVSSANSSFGGGKPITKNHKPPSYLAAVQQLQLQKQQQQQMAALAEKQTQQQMLAAAAQILPSATTLKRVEINTVTKKIESHEVITPETVAAILSSSKQHPEAAGNNSTATAINKICDKATDKTHSVTITSTTTSSSATAPQETLGKLPNNERQEPQVAKVEVQPTIVPICSISNATAISTTPKVSTTNTVVGTLTSPSVPSPILRNSSASSSVGNVGQGNNNGSTGGGGEDSGIESMDALSEKSPHQQSSSSPAQQLQANTLPITSINPVEPPNSNNNNKATNVSTKNEMPIESKNANSSSIKKEETISIVDDDEIEKALAKMEGITDETHSSAECNKSTLQLKPKEETPTMNGEPMDPHVCAASINLKNETNDDLIKNLTQTIVDSTDFKSTLAINVSEKKSSVQIVGNDETAIVESVASHEKFEKITLNDSSNGVKRETDEIKINQCKSILNEKDNLSGIQTTGPICKDSVKEVKTQLNVLQPISIDIPDTDTRIRTRSSSRLESPLEQVKTISPRLESLDSSTIVPCTITLNKHLSSRTAANERIASRPKTPVTSVSIANHTISNVSNNKDLKRKRPEHESNELLDSKRVRSINSNIKKSIVMEDTPCSTSTVQSTNEQENSSEPETTVSIKEVEIQNETEVANVSSKNTRESSSDSDEPLIEIASKARNCKSLGTEGNTEEEEANYSPSPPTAAASKTKDISIESEDNNKLSSLNTSTHVSTTHIEKPTRASNRAQNLTNTKSSIASTTSTSTTISTTVSNIQSSSNISNISPTMPNVRNVKNSISMTSTANIVTSATTSIASTTTTNSQSVTNISNNTLNSANISSNTPLTPTIHATRGSTQNAGAISCGITTNNNINNNNSSVVDEKIGTRRSVRASAAANKIIFSRSTAATAAVQGAEAKSAPASKTESTGEARRKTRSAVIGEALLTEGRRRRGSRDFK